MTAQMTSLASMEFVLSTTEGEGYACEEHYEGGVAPTLALTHFQDCAKASTRQKRSGWGGIKPAPAKKAPISRLRTNKCVQIFWRPLKLAYEEQISSLYGFRILSCSEFAAARVAVQQFKRQIRRAVHIEITWFQRA
jgi:hypothetical protein